MVRDVTKRKALEVELRARCEEAQAASRAKAEFLANMSHEIRTPLTAIMGFAGLLEGSAELPAGVRAHVAKICAASEQLMGVVNDVLDFSRLDARQVVLDPQPVDPAAFLTETVALLAGQAAAKGLEIGVDVAAGPAGLGVARRRAPASGAAVQSRRQRRSSSPPRGKSQ